MQMEDVDVGCVNGRYFINVCGAGLFTNVSQTVNIDLKNLIGKMAYYLKGAGQLPSFRPFKLRVEANGEVYEDNFILFLVLNSGSAGGFKLQQTLRWTMDFTILLEFARFRFQK